jgi:hypothetical protein
LAERRQVDAELEALRTTVVFVCDLILGDTNGSSSLVASLSMMAYEVEKWVNAMAANGVRWGTRSALVTALSYFPELEPELELLRFGQDIDLSGSQADVLCPLVSMALDSLASLIPSSLARDPSDVME